MEAGRIARRGIEWDSVRDLLSREARTEMGRERALTADPLTEVSEVQSAVEATRQARLALACVGPPPLETVVDVRPALDRCRLAGSVLEAAELASLIPLLEAGSRLRGYGRSAAPAATTLAALTDRLPRAGELDKELRAAIAEDGAIKDDASPALRRARREIRDRRRRVVSDLEQLLHGSDADRVFADRFVTVRHGRYVLPVRAEARARVPGIVHDRSQSGQTLFVEPAASVEANNDLVQLAAEEAREVVRILAALTDAVRRWLPELDALVDGIGALDWIFARAHLAERMEATAPVIVEDRMVAIRGARHPLLVAQRWQNPEAAGLGPVVPVDLTLGADRPLLVVTGPNAGGKTIALKTLALHTLMAQTGCHLPAEDARLPIFRGIHAIIGDDQSVAENLSTFSAFVQQVRAVLATADAGSLVLLDELGAGTDPDEGAALAQAILEELDSRGALVMATSHLEPLKAFASTHPRARNASVEFDTATLAPTFRLRYDQPGQSYALTIAARLGLPPALIERAQAHRSEHAARLSELVARLDEASRREGERALAIERREQEAAVHLAAAREAEVAATAHARELTARAKTEATALLADIRRAISAEWDRLKESERSRRDLDESRRRLKTVAARVTPEAPPDPESNGTPLAPGASVSAEHLGVHGELIAIAGATATVRSGAVTVRVPLSALRRAGGQAPAARDPHGRSQRSAARPGVRSPDPAGDSPDRTIAGELLLLGRTTDEARDLVEQYLDDAFMAGLTTVRLVHGKGTGALRRAVRELLAAHPLIASYRDGEPAEGGAGATVAALKVS